ncbi:PRC-barrel domain-containing protein [Roseinatronobacter alkalisoli]|uniref:PRC-barrel domain-containing protein n=1 Tax=Roseinatronobacter alkalisoli TaxID=3028235 RepID=A0ABT5T892_9RHOB|nr:PRC-barrel domain-containing protein [Roseinatronobacter sp. HJB301]MDD7971352.1 PRC-barrel domain-containing protein [Roseinatronobacter sp. HJB301]
MNKLMLTTAIVAITATGAVAQTTGATGEGDATAMAGGDNQFVPAFLSSDFTGKNLYTLDTEHTRTLTEDRAAEDHSIWDRTRMRWESNDAFIPNRDAWENIGNIDDIVMTKDGEIRGILIDVGGFLGLGARTVMVDINELYFVADDTAPEDLSDFFVVAAMSQEQLEALPEWDEAQLSIGYEAQIYDDAAAGQDIGMLDDDGDMVQNDATMTGQTDMTGTDPALGEQSDMAGADPAAQDGYTAMGEQDLTADNLLGASVHGAEGDNIATVDDVVLADDGVVTHIIIDVGGFLGLGSHTVALEPNDIEIMWDDATGNVRVQVPMTQEQLETLPEYQG